MTVIEVTAAPLTIALAPTVGGDPGSATEQPAALAAYLERCLDRPVRVVVESSYAATVDGLRTGRLDGAVMGELASLRGQETAGVEPLVVPVMANGQIPTYESVIVTRIDAGLHDLPSLRGVTIGLVDEQSTSGYVVPRAMLREAGIDPDVDVTMRLYGRHAAVVEAVLTGEVVAGATHAGRLLPPTLDRGPDYARLRVIASSRPIPRGPIVVRADLPAVTRAALAAALVEVHAADSAAAAVLNVGRGQRFTHAARRQVPTLKSIAALAGVSYATVSRVVNGSGYVAPSTAARVSAIVEELGYRPNGNALTLQGQRAPIVGMVVSARDSAGDDQLDRLRTELAASGIPLVFCPVDGSLADSLYIDLLLDGRLGALVVTAAHAADPALARVARTGRAIFAIAADKAAPGVARADGRNGAQTIMAALGMATVAPPPTRRSASRPPR